jgi:norsolorinic acid ketoreductase
VIAGLRNISSATSASLHKLPHRQDSEVVLVKIDSALETDTREAVDTLKSQYGIDKLDIVIANTGISNYFGKAKVTPAEEMAAHFRINAVTPLLLFQAAAPLLKAATAPEFIVLSSGAGSLASVEKLPVENTAYSASKAAVNFVTRRIHCKNPKLIAFPINPGWLQTDVY